MPWLAIGRSRNWGFSSRANKRDLLRSYYCIIVFLSPRKTSWDWYEPRSMSTENVLIEFSPVPWQVVEHENHKPRWTSGPRHFRTLLAKFGRSEPSPRSSFVSWNRTSAMSRWSSVTCSHHITPFIPDSKYYALLYLIFPAFNDLRWHDPSISQLEKLIASQFRSPAQVKLCGSRASR